MRETRTMKGYAESWNYFKNMLGEGYDFKDGDCVVRRNDRFIHFMTQTITLGDFIECGEDGKLLEEPNAPLNYLAWKYEEFGDVLDSEMTDYEDRLIEYQAAKDRVIFEGFELGNETSEVYQIYSDDHRLIFNKQTGECLRTPLVENLIELGVTLTQSKYESLYK